MSKHLSKKRVLATLSIAAISTLLVQAYVFAQPTTPPPGGNIDASFNTISSNNGITSYGTFDSQGLIENSNGMVEIDDELIVGGVAEFIYNAIFDAKVGIGTATPSELLVVGTDIGDVNTNNTIAIGSTAPTGAPGLTLGESTNNNARINWSNAFDALVLYTRAGGIDNFAQLFLASSGNVGIGTDTPSENLVIGDDLGEVYYDSAGLVVGDSSAAAHVTVGKDSLNNGSMFWFPSVGGLELRTRSGGTENSSQLFLAGNGKIGMGTIYPFAKLQIGTPTSVDTTFHTAHPNGLALAANATNTEPAIWMGKSDSMNTQIVYDGTNGNLSFETTNTFGNPDHLVLDGNGNVGINAGTNIDNSALLVKPHLPNVDNAIRGEYDANNYGYLGGELGYGMGSQAQQKGVATYVNPPTTQTIPAVGVEAIVNRTNAFASYYAGMFIDSTTQYGALGTYYGLYTDKLTVNQSTDVDGYLASFNKTSSDAYIKGLEIQLGNSTQGTAAHMIDFKHYNGTDVGSITKVGDTVSYNAFTGGHITSIPQTSEGYEYGTLMSLKSAKTDEGSQQPKYYSEPTNNSYDNSIFGVYSGKYSEENNTHQIYALGDGHALVTTENGSIKAGDPITSSNIEGKGMKATQAGTILGYALEDWDGASSTRTETLADGTQVKVGLIAVYYYPGTYYAGNQQEQIDALKQEIAELKTLIKQ